MWDILLSEIFHQINCQSSNSLSRTAKHVQTSFACRQKDANDFAQNLLNLLACKSVKVAKLYTASRIQPSTCGKEFKFQLCFPDTGLLWSLITNQVWWQHNWLQGLLVPSKLNKKQIPKARSEMCHWESRISDAIPHWGSSLHLHIGSFPGEPVSIKCGSALTNVYWQMTIILIITIYNHLLTYSQQYFHRHYLTWWPQVWEKSAELGSLTFNWVKSWCCCQVVKWRSCALSFIPDMPSFCETRRL